MSRRWAILALLWMLAPEVARAAPPPKLVVMIIVDQLGSSHLTRYRSHLRGGLSRLATTGAYYPNGVHAVGISATGPGHANIATGAWPDVHGIVSNKWFDTSAGREVNCVEDPAFGRGPAQLMAPTIADAMKLASGGRSRVVALAGKDRAAILIGGQSPDVVAWYDARVGRHITGTYQRMAAPTWLDRVNLQLSAAPVFGKRWERLRPELHYEEIAGPDDSPLEGEVPGIGRKFPRVLGRGQAEAGAGWFESYPYSPPSTDAILQIAKHAIDALQLGRGPDPDFLGLAPSTLDYVGHSYGLESQETFDTLLRIDRGLGDLMDYVDSSLGKDAVLWVLSGDHGIAPTPERAEVDSGFGRRQSQPELEQLVDRGLAASSDSRTNRLRVRLIYGPALFLSPGGGPEDRLRAARAAATTLAAHPSVAEAHAHEDLRDFVPEFRPYFERLIFPGRTADVYFRLRAGYVLAGQAHGRGGGSNHGSPYVPDTHVPIYLAGPGVRPGVDRRSVDVTRIAPSVSALLGIGPPAASLETPLPAALAN